MIALELAGWPLAAGLSAVAAIGATELRRRAELVARACHEVRGPLGAARLALAAMERRGEADPARVAGLDLELRRAGLALDDLAAARRGARAPEVAAPVELAVLLEEQRFVWGAMARAFGGELVVEDTSGAWVHADRLRLAQALGNLVANAVEHGRGRIALTARPAGPGAVRVEVADEGDGLPAALGDLTRRARGGRGLRGRGLAIADEVARAHGGRLETAPSARGARLVLELPALPAGAARGAR